MHYEVSAEVPGLLRVSLSISQPIRGCLKLAMASFRPGRYQEGNFTANLLGLSVREEKGTALIPEWISPEMFQVEAASLHLTYSILARDLSAGNTYFSDDLLIINPVTCCFFLPDFPETGIEVRVKAPFELYSTLPQELKGLFSARDFDHFADCPILGASLSQLFPLEVPGYSISLIMFGKAPDLPADFIPKLRELCRFQIGLFHALPTDIFFFYLISPEFPAHHGVEHLDNTVCLLGPRKYLGTEKYTELLSLLSHEFLHVWNVKQLRPNSLNPYTFTERPIVKESYLIEGITTYLGDKFLWSSGAISRSQWVQILEAMINRYLAKPSRFMQSLGQSSCLVWSNGYSRLHMDYVQSIYNEGAIFSFLLDAELAKHGSSVETLLAKMNLEYGIRGVGYRELDFQQLAELECSASLSWLFDGFVNRGEDMWANIPDALKAWGMEWRICNDLPPYARLLGIKAISTLGIFGGMYPTPGYAHYFLKPGDRIVSINGQSWTPLFPWELIRGDSAVVEFEREGQFFNHSMPVLERCPFQVELLDQK